MDVIIKNLKVFSEHNGNKYLVYFEETPKEQLYFEFSNRWNMEEFLYMHGIEKFDYKSSNGSVITKIWKYIPKKLEDWKNSSVRTAKEKKQGTPKKYSWDDWFCGHFVKESTIMQIDKLEKIEEIKNELLKLEFNVDSKGTLYWAEAIEYIKKHPIDDWKMFDIYKYVALKHSSTIPRVERCFRTAIAPAIENIQKKYDYNKRITNKTFLNLIGLELL